MSDTEPGLDWHKRTARDTHLAELRKMKIGPLFPADPDRKPGMEPRKVGRGGKDTKAPWIRPHARRERPVTANCLSCQWSATGSTWRPVKARLAEHVAQRHTRIAA